MARERTRQIASAIDLGSLRLIQAADLLDFDFGRQIRSEADKRKRSGRAIVCSKCERPVIVPMHWRTREYYFRHFQRDVDCPWTSDEAIGSMDEASARIFFGQQEGLLHLRLKEALGALIAPLPNVTECIVDQYFINSKGERRRPDVRFVYHGKVFVLEIQLATTQRPIITERNDFYIGEGVEIIWITWNPIRGKISDYRASFIDIITDHNDNLFSVDESTFDLTRISGELKLRVNWWEGDDCKERIVGLNELVLREGKPPYAIARPPEWHELHKDEWYAAGHQKLITDTECRRLWAEIQQKLSQPLSEDEASTDWEVVSMISLLISLEHGVPVNSQQKNLTEMLHTFLTTKRRKPMARIVAFAIGATKNSSLLERQKTKELLSLALVERQVSKSSLAARVVRLLFPEWAKHRPTN